MAKLQLPSSVVEGMEKEVEINAIRRMVEDLSFQLVVKVY